MQVVSFASKNKPIPGLKLRNIIYICDQYVLTTEPQSQSCWRNLKM